MDCNEMEEWLSAYVDHELSPKEQQWIETHLSTCTDCRRIVQQYQALSAPIHKEFLDHIAPEGAAEGVLHEVSLLQSAEHRFRIIGMATGSLVGFTGLVLAGGTVLIWPIMWGFIRFLSLLTHGAHLWLLQLLVGQQWLTTSIVVVGILVIGISTWMIHQSMKPWWRSTVGTS